MVVATRRSLDRLRSQRDARETYVGPWLPEPQVARDPVAPTPPPDPAAAVQMADDVSFAMLVVMDSLPPTQRAAFVLHDVFGRPFSEVAAALHTSEVAARKAASRARDALRHRDHAPAGQDGGPAPHERHAMAATFLAACESGDLSGLMALLAPDVTLTSDGGGVVSAARNVLHGPDAVARFMLGILARVPGVTLEPVLVNGQPGVVAHTSSGPVVGTSVVGRDGRISAVHIVANPDKLAHLDPATPDADAQSSRDADR